MRTTVSTTCPPWCNGPGTDHESCEGSSARIAVDGGNSALAAYLFRLDSGTPVLAVYRDNWSDSELDLPGVDALIDGIEEFLPKLRAMRAQLAADTAQAAGGAR